MIAVHITINTITFGIQNVHPFASAQAYSHPCVILINISQCNVAFQVWRNVL